jgi:hypothetical protein
MRDSTEVSVRIASQKKSEIICRENTTYTREPAARTRHQPKEQFMKTSSRQFRHGFLDCGILFLLIACAAAVIVLVKSASPQAPGVPQPMAPNPVIKTADTVRAVAKAGTAVAGLTRVADADPSAVAAPAVDVPVVDPDAGDGPWELLEEILEAL